jgi:predicted PurR-regulated permease PerM
MHKQIFQGASFVLTLVALFLVLHFGLIPGFIAGMVAFALTRTLGNTKLFKKAGGKALSLAAAVVVLVPLLGLVLAGFEITQVVTSAVKDVPGLTDHLVNVALDWRARLPGALSEHIPQERAALQTWLGHVMQEQAPMLAGVGKTWAHGLLIAFLGLIVGALAAAGTNVPSDKPLAVAIRERAATMYSAFVQIVVAQFWVAAINAGLTAVFLFVVLPLCGSYIPYSAGLVLLTFTAGLLPIVGNLLCNGVLTLAGLGVGPHVALACLVFLIAIHKLEYIISAKVVGSRIATSVWEVITVIVAFEIMFGMAGLVAAPLYYAYLKLDMKNFGWV